MLKLCLVDRSAAKLSFVSLVLTIVDLVAIPLSVDMGLPDPWAYVPFFDSNASRSCCDLAVGTARLAENLAYHVLTTTSSSP